METNFGDISKTSAIGQLQINTETNQRVLEMIGIV